MGLAQTLLTIAAISLLSMITLTLNSSYLTTNQVMIESEFSVEAVSLAESYLERAIGKNFDENGISSHLTDTKDLTKKHKLGTESGEDPKKLNLFNDFDDFDGYTAVDSTERASYNIAISVVYVNDNNPSIISGSETWHKRMTITVSNQYMSTPIQSQFIYSYF